MKPKTTDSLESTEGLGRFSDVMKKIIGVPHSVVKQRIEEAQKQKAEARAGKKKPKR
jgi:hypothetical protein